MTLQMSDRYLFRAWSQDVREIKTLFNDRKYKRCAGRCEELYPDVVHPIHKAFLNFYQALCRESLGNAAHIFSKNKLLYLTLARDSFVSALENLDEPCLEDGINEHRVILHREMEYSSPTCATLDVVERYQYPSPMVELNTGSPGIREDIARVYDGIRISDSHAALNLTPSSAYSPAPVMIHVDPTHDEDTFDSYKPSHKLERQTNHLSEKHPPALLLSKVPMLEGTSIIHHKVRLSRCLSSNHCLVDALVPSPLFRRNRGSMLNDQQSGKTVFKASEVSPFARKAEFPGVENGAKFSKDNDEDDKENIPPDDENSDYDEGDGYSDNFGTTLEPFGPGFQDRPLPALPFKNNPHFEKRGSRHILIPSINTASAHTVALGPHSPDTPQWPRPRASAIETLVAKFENKILEASTSFTSFPLTPMTPRFQMIENIFAANDNLDDNANFNEELNPKNSAAPSSVPDIKTPIHKIHRSSHSPPTSRYQPPSSPLAPPFSTTPQSPRLTSSLISFRHSIQDHIDSVTTRIETVTLAQEERKARGMGRSMSFWSFDVEGGGKKPVPKEGVRGRRLERI